MDLKTWISIGMVVFIIGGMIFLWKREKDKKK